MKGKRNGPFTNPPSESVKWTLFLRAIGIGRNKSSSEADVFSGFPVSLSWSLLSRFMTSVGRALPFFLAVRSMSFSSLSNFFTASSHLGDSGMSHW